MLPGAGRPLHWQPDYFTSRLQVFAMASLARLTVANWCAPMREVKMRVLVDLVDSFTGMVRFIILAMMVVGLGITLILTAGASYVAPKVAEDVGERATLLGERAIEEARDARREREFAQDGWGYGSGDSRQERVRGSGSRDRYSSGGDWGEGTR